MRHLLSLMLTLLLVLPGLAVSQDLSPGDAKPLVTVSFSGYGELQKDAAYLGQLMNNPQMGQMLDTMITMGTGGQGLASVDPNRPWGVTVQTDADQFPVLGFVPVSDIGKFVDLLKSVDMTVTDNGDGTYTIDTPTNQPLAMRYQNGWAYLADNATRLEQLPADPVKTLGSLPGKYDLGALIHVVNLPQPIRQMISANLSMGAAMAAQRQPEETDEQFAMRKMATQNAIKQFNRMIEQLDKYLVGLAMKRDAGTAMIDVAVSAQPDTELAGQFATMADTKTNFFGFADESAAVWANWARDLTDDEVLQLKAYVAEAQKGAEKALEEQDLSADDLEKARGMLAELFTVVNENLEAKKTDGGVAVYAGSNQLTVTAGGYLADGPKLEGLVKKFVEQLAIEKPEIRELVQLDAETYKGVNFHVVSLPTEELDEGAEVVAKLMGNPTQAIIGFGPNSGYVALGKDAAATLKAIIDTSQANAGQKISPGKMVVKLTPIVQLVADAADDPQTQQIAGALSAALSQAPGKDLLLVETRPIPNGAMTRITLEEGVLRVIGASVQQVIQATQGAMQAQPAGPGIQPAGPDGGF